MKIGLPVKNILVIDLELNQPSEKIIELGYVVGNPKSDVIHARSSILINPHEQLTEEIVNLTGISQDMVNTGMSLEYAYEKMLGDVEKYNAISLIHQWGVYDASLLQRQLDLKTEWAFGRRFLDVKALSQAHSIIHGMNCFGGLKKMAARLGIAVQNDKQHRADYDAEITFRLYGALASYFLRQ